MYKLPENIEQFSYKNIPDISTKRVLIRACLNADVDDNGKVVDATRIKEAAAGIKYFAENAKQVVILAHLGRPTEYSKGLSFWNVAEILSQEVGMPIEFAAYKSDAKMDSKIILMDNVRFFENEESKDAEKRAELAKEYASLGNVFVNDAFPDYREAASTYDIAKLLPSFVGPKFLSEIEALSKFDNPEKPFLAVLGGAKLSEKLDALKALAEVADKVLIGGAMAYTLLKAKNIEIGNSLFEPEKLDVAKEIIQKYSEKIILPTDHLVCDTFDETSAQNSSVIDQQNIPNGKIAIDLGPDSIQIYKDELANAKSILWNGPMGVTEWEISAKGTKAIGEAIAANQSAYILAGGGDSISAINKYNLTGFDHISTGGGAMLAFLAYDKFPTLDVIVQK